MCGDENYREVREQIDLKNAENFREPERQNIKKKWKKEMVRMKRGIRMINAPRLFFVLQSPMWDEVRGEVHFLPRKNLIYIFPLCWKNFRYSFFFFCFSNLDSNPYYFLNDRDLVRMKMCINWSFQTIPKRFRIGAIEK